MLPALAGLLEDPQPHLLYVAADVTVDRLHVIAGHAQHKSGKKDLTL